MLAHTEGAPTFDAFVYAVRLGAHIRHLAELVEKSAGMQAHPLPVRERTPILLEVASDMRALARMLENEVYYTDEE